MKLNRLSALIALCIVPVAFAQTTTAQPVQDPRTMPAEVVTPPEQTPPAEIPATPAPQQPQQVIVLPEKVIETSVDLTTGECLEEPANSIPAWPARIADGKVWIGA